MGQDWMEKKASRYEEGLEVWEEGTKEFFGFLKDKSAVAQATAFMKGFSETMATMAYYSGMLNPMKDEIKLLFESIGGGITERLAPALASFQKLLGPFAEAIGTTASAVLTGINTIVESGLSLLDNLIPEGATHPATGEAIPSFSDLIFQALPGALLGIPFSVFNVLTWGFTGSFII